MGLVRAAQMLTLTLLALGPAGAPSAGEATPAALARAFCAAVRAGDEDAAEALMTAELQAAIAALRVSDARFRETYPEDKPPLGDGLRLAAFPDTPESCTPEEVSATSVVLAYVPAGAPDGAWRDRLALAPDAGGGFLVADILYAPDGEGSFRAWLAASADWD